MMTPSADICCTCAQVLSAPAYKDKEAYLPQDRRVDCCTRIICGKCIHKNERFAHYCPFCQVSTAPSILPQGLKEPPAYSSIPSSSSAPPPYTPASKCIAPNPTTTTQAAVDDEKAALAVPEDVLHFLDHHHDTIASLSLRYGVPAHALRQTNNITSDHLLLGRRTVLIPGQYYRGGVSLSPRPVEGEEEELRKSKIRRFMTDCKVSNYDIAVLYLEQADYNLATAVAAYLDDDRWENEHSQERRSKGKNRTSLWSWL